MPYAAYQHANLLPQINWHSPQAKELYAVYIPWNGGIFDPVRRLLCPVTGATINRKFLDVGTKSNDYYANCGQGFPGSGSITILARVSIVDNTTLQVVLGKDESGQRQFGFGLNATASNQLYISVGDGGTLNTSTISYAYSLNTDLQIAATIAGSGVNRGAQFYVDGQSLGSGTSAVSTTHTSTTATLYLGRRGFSGFANPFGGKIWWVRVYNRILSASEIQDTYQRPDDLWLPSPLFFFGEQAAAPPSTTTSNLLLLGVG